MKLVVLAGGVGGARFLSGLVKVADPEDITAIVNTGDDITLYGLYISPDIDIVTYTLAGIVHPDQGWGIKDDTFQCLRMLGSFGYDTWFNLGDKDLGVHIHRTARLREGRTLAQVTDEIRRAMGLGIWIIPMSNQVVTTKINTGQEIISFQEYLVQRRACDPVKEILFEGIQKAQPAPGALEAIINADGIIIAPSNPLVSIGTILAVAGIREALRACSGPKIAISPIVGGTTIKGPADRMMRDMGYEASALGVARMYRGTIDTFIIDIRDAECRHSIEDLGIRVIVRDTIMCSEERKTALASEVIKDLEAWK